MSIIKTALIAGAALILGAALGYFLSQRTISRLRRKLRSIREGKGEGKMETTKKVIWSCLIMGFAWVWCSYVLAYLDKAQIAESLSQVAVTEIIGVVLAYALKSLVENLSKNNHWPDKRPAEALAEPEEDPPNDGGDTVG